MTTASVLVRTTANNLLDFIANEGKVPMIMPAEQILSALFNVSRSVLSQAYAELETKGIVRREMRSRLVLRAPIDADYFARTIKVNSKTQLVENFILEKFANDELKPGDKLSELQIAKESGANTVTVREVLLKISSTGIIRKDPRKKWEVIQLTVATMSDITDYRQLLELHGLKCLLSDGRLDEHSRPVFERLMKRHERSLAKQTIPRDEVIELENDFHKSLVQFTGNQVMRESYESIFFVTRFHLRQRGMTQERFRRLIPEHTAVLAAILSDNYDEAVRCLKNHFVESKAFFRQANQTDSP